jgi:hypothetical protein
MFLETVLFKYHHHHHHHGLEDGGPWFCSEAVSIYSSFYPVFSSFFSYFSLYLFTLSSHLVFHVLIPSFLSDLAKNILFRTRSSFIHVTCPTHCNLLILTYFATWISLYCLYILELFLIRHLPYSFIAQNCT